MGILSAIGICLIAKAIRTGRINRIQEEQYKTEQQRKKDLEKQRKNTPYLFDEGFSERYFQELVYRKAKRIKGISKVRTDGLVVYCTVTSVSGKTEWNFKLDFNDYGRFTGRCWTRTDNHDSCIPGRLRDVICRELAY